MTPTPPPLVVSPAALAVAARSVADAAADTVAAVAPLRRSRLSSDDVSAEGEALLAAQHRLLARARGRLVALSAGLDDDAARLARCGADYVSSDTVAAHALAGPR